MTLNRRGCASQKLQNLLDRTEIATYIWNDHGEFGVQCVVHLADGSFVTPEGVVVLTVLGVRVSDCGEHLVPRRGIGVRLRHAVRRLPANRSTGSLADRCSAAVHVKTEKCPDAVYL